MPPRASAVAAVAAIAFGSAAGSFTAASLGGHTPAAARHGVRPAYLTSAWVLPVPPGASTQGPSAASAKSAARRADPLHQVVLPDVFAVAPGAVTAAELAKLAKLRYVRSVIAVDGGEVKVNGRAVSVIGVNPGQFRSWTPPQTAARQRIWTALSHGQFVTAGAAGRRLHLRAGKSYRIAGARQPTLTFGGSAATIGIPRVGAIVNTATSRQLGLVRQIGVLISAPGASLARLDAKVRSIFGRKSQFLSLRPARHAARQSRLPVDGRISGGRPPSYLALFRDSAALYCPGLPWSVLAAIGQIESGDGQNVGPSSAGALGPMQFMPSTWAVWGIDGFGDTGPPDIMNPFDAVPSAAEYLCAAGGAGGGAALSRAIFAYNHAQWYVNEVLALAHEYAQEYG
jgi:Transglycosylase SLT domain